MTEQTRSIFKGDIQLLSIVLVLSLISVITMFSAISSVAYKTENLYAPWIGHCMHLLLGIVCFFAVYAIPWKWVKAGTYGLVAIAFVTLTMLAAGMGVSVNGASRALSLGGFPIQPIEFAKLAMIMLFADRLSRYQQNKPRLPMREWLILGACFFPVTLLVAVQNLSSAIMIFIVCFFIMYIGRVRFSILLGIACTLIVMGGIAVSIGHFKPEVMPARYTTWVSRVKNIGEDPVDKNGNFIITDENRQPLISKIAIANGRYPKGPGSSIERDFLPLAFMDYIFAIIVEEYSIAGAVFIMLLFFGILMRAGYITKKSADPHISLLSVGLAICIVLQACISMGVSVGFGPVTGQPLPLISRGGFSILFTMIYLGLLYKMSAKVQTEQTENQNQPS